MIYSYFEKGCWKKCTRQSQKVLWVVLSSLFFKKFERMARSREAIDVCLRMLKKSNNLLSHITFRDCRTCTFLPTTFLKIAVYKRVRVTTLGQSLPILKHLLSHPPPTPWCSITLNCFNLMKNSHTFAFASLTISSETTGFRVFFVPDWKKKLT